MLTVLRAKYVNHFALLSEAIHYLSSDCISLANLDRCDLLLKDYVKLFQKFFGIRNMTSNIHLLTHLVQVVRNWGPIWVHEGFIFEAWNKKIMEFVTSPHSRTNQIATRFLMHKFIITALYNETVSPETKKFIAKQIKMPVEDNGIEIRDRIIGFGKSIMRLPTEDESEILMNAGYEPTNIKCFNRMKLNGIKYGCKNDNNFKFCDSVIFYNGMFGKIIAIINFCYNNETVGGVLIQQLRKIRYAFNTQHICEVVASDNIVFIQESALIKPAVQIDGSKKKKCD